MKKLWKFTAVVAATALIASACGDDDSSSDTTAAGGDSVPAAESDIKVAVVYIGSPEDKGWTYQHDQGIKELEAELGIEVKRIENQAEGPEAQATFESLAEEGYDLIFATSYGYGEPMALVADKYPEQCFQWATGGKINLTSEEAPEVFQGPFKTFADVPTNLGYYFGAAEEARYLSGMAAGAATKTNKIGYVAAFNIPEVIRGINGFTLGVRAVNPDATVQVTWTNSWTDVEKEKQAAEALLDGGADVIAQHSDSTNPGIAAETRGKYWVGYNTDAAEAAPKAWLTAPTWDWGIYYIKAAKDVLAGTCPSDEYYGTMADGFVTLGSYGDSVAQETRDLIDAKKEEIIAGTFNPFTGPIVDQDGKVVIEDGVTPDYVALTSQFFFVEGVIGSVTG